MLEPGFGYIRIAAFQADTAADFERVLADLQKESGGLKGAVIDLRSNPGGLLVSAVQIADDLLPKGSIVRTRGPIAFTATTFSATPANLPAGPPTGPVVAPGT